MVAVKAAWLHDPRARAVSSILEGAGHQALFVGGCVRNALLNAPVTDIDIATDALPEDVLALARAAGLKAVPTGIEHGTITVVSDHQPFEVTTFRRDVETDGRRAIVSFTDDVGEDAARRDFTMNALYARADGQVLDPVGEGLQDLSARRVRFVGDPARRIAEDYLRILRLFRFHAWYGNTERGLDPSALDAVAAGRAGLKDISRERIGSEMVKLLAAPDPSCALEAMAQTGVLPVVLPGAQAAGLRRLVAAEHAAGVPPRWQRRLAALGRTEGWPAALRLGRADARVLRDLEAARERPADAAALGYWFGAEVARDAVLLRWDGGGAGAALEAAILEGAGARFPLRASDLAPLEGPALGAALRQLERAWVESGFRLNADDLKALLRRG